ncbi:MAG: hypothetical protein H8E85_05665 [Candidatus Marinimicrobia bacterium]|nr:hypothetical protein [Candidatus Neomarinimicrobiota bacterium]
MNHYRQNNIIKYLFIFAFSILLFAENASTPDPWKIDIQILLGFSENQVDGVMGEATFEALKSFAIEHDLTDVVLRGEYDDLGFWGFQQYIIKYNQYWLRELKNRTIIEDVVDVDYLRKGDETLSSLEKSIENAQIEVERLIHAKSKSKRIAHENRAMDKWQKEKKEAERIISALGEAILTAEEEADKWGMERIRALRLAEEQEQLERLEERKLEAVILTSDLEDVIRIAKKEINRLVDENNKLKNFLTTSADTKSMAEALKSELKQARLEMDSLSVQKDSLEKKLQYIESKVGEKVFAEFDKENAPVKKKRWYRWLWPFGKK